MEKDVGREYLIVLIWVFISVMVGHFTYLWGYRDGKILCGKDTIAVTTDVPKGKAVVIKWGEQDEINKDADKLRNSGKE